MSDNSSTFRVSPFAPANETEADLFFDRANLDGASLGSIAYGVHMTLFFLCFSLLLKGRKQDRKSSRIFLTYIIINFALGSIGNAVEMRFTELAYVDNRDYPGGPNGFEIEQNSYWFNVMGYGVYIVNTWLQDGLLLYRFLVIWSFNYWILIIPALLYVVSVIMSCLFLAQVAQPGNTLFGNLSINFGLTFWSISIATTLLVTLLIVFRLLFMRYRLREIMGPSHQSPYVSLSAILVESAFLYSTIGLVFIITFGRNNPAQALFLPVLGQVQSIAPLLIILRVAQGHACGKDTFKDTTATSPHVVWRNPSQTGSTTYALSNLQSKKTESSPSRNGNTAFDHSMKTQTSGVEEGALVLSK